MRLGMLLPQECRVLVAFGANLGDREGVIRAGLAAVGAAAGVRLVAVSPLYASDPVGYADQPEFINGVAAFDTLLAPEAFLALLLRTELQQGRVRGIPNGPRTLDLDVLFYDGESAFDSPVLQLPHPRWRERAFVTAPLADLLALDSLASDARWAGVRRALAGTDRVTGVRRLA